MLFFIILLFTTTQYSYLQDGKFVTLESTPNLPIESAEKKSTISCKSAVRADTGEYHITVENEHGSDSSSISVVVLSEYIFIQPNMIRMQG